MELLKRDDGQELLLWAETKLAPDQRQSDIEAGILRGIASTNTIDRDSERLERGCFDKSIPKFLDSGGPIQWAHMSTIPVVGRTMEIKSTDDGYPFVAQLNIDEPLELSQNLANRPHPKLLHTLYAGGWVRSFSVGMLPNWDAISDKAEHKWEGQRGPTYLEAELVEISCCNIGSNRDALSQLHQIVVSGCKAFGVDASILLSRARTDNTDWEEDTGNPAAEHRLELRPAKEFSRYRRLESVGKRPDKLIGYRADGASSLAAFIYPITRFSVAEAEAHARQFGGDLVKASGGSVPEIPIDVPGNEGEDRSVQAIRSSRADVQAAIKALTETR